VNNISNHQSSQIKQQIYQVESFDETDKNTSNYSNCKVINIRFGYCIRTGQQIPFDVKRPYSLEAYRSFYV
jgi:RNA polymerase-binding transcription factor DksA